MHFLPPAHTGFAEGSDEAAAILQWETKLGELAASLAVPAGGAQLTVRAYPLSSFDKEVDAAVLSGTPQFIASAVLMQVIIWMH